MKTLLVSLACAFAIANIAPANTITVIEQGENALFDNIVFDDNSLHASYSSADAAKVTDFSFLSDPGQLTGWSIDLKSRLKALDCMQRKKDMVGHINSVPDSDSTFALLAMICLIVIAGMSWHKKPDA